MKLEVGMYVRYQYEEIVYIGKITFISEIMCGLDETLEIDIDNCIEPILKRNIIKEPSYNIIDLIEVGDYVNGGQVREKVEDYIRISGGNFMFQYLKENEIKSIVTKEQFESMSYKIGD